MRVTGRAARGTSPAHAVPTLGVHAVLTHKDVPGEKRYGLEFRDQPVLAFGFARKVGFRLHLSPYGPAS